MKCTFIELFLSCDFNKDCLGSEQLTRVPRVQKVWSSNLRSTNLTQRCKWLVAFSKMCCPSAMTRR